LDKLGIHGSAAQCGYGCANLGRVERSLTWHLGCVSVHARSFGDALMDPWNRWRLTDQRRFISYCYIPSIYIFNILVLIVLHCLCASRLLCDRVLSFKVPPTNALKLCYVCAISLMLSTLSPHQFCCFCTISRCIFRLHTLISPSSNIGIAMTSPPKRPLERCRRTSYRKPERLRYRHAPVYNLDAAASSCALPPLQRAHCCLD
jgi:hypothetical protein